MTRVLGYVFCILQRVKAVSVRVFRLSELGGVLAYGFPLSRE